MKSIVVEGKTLDEAINKALEQLQVSRDHISVEILEEGSRGLFGFVGGKPAKARITVNQTLINERQATLQTAQQAESLPEKAIQKEKPSEPADQQEKRIPDDEQIQQIVTTAKQALQVILDTLQIEYSVEVKKREDQILLNIHCENENFLIGRRGTTLDAVQYLVNRIANKHAQEKIQVVLDTSDYRIHRKQRLQKLAVRLSRRVKMTGKPVTVSPMNPHDRRIIHLTLQDDPAVKTLSRGTGFMRRITISATKTSGRNRTRK